VCCAPHCVSWAHGFAAEGTSLEGTLLDFKLYQEGSSLVLEHRCILRATVELPAADHEGCLLDEFNHFLMVVLSCVARLLCVNNLGYHMA
jgi:hypothetical protein